MTTVEGLIITLQKDVLVQLMYPTKDPNNELNFNHITVDDANIHQLQSHKSGLIQNAREIYQTVASSMY